MQTQYGRPDKQNPAVQNLCQGEPSLDEPVVATASKGLPEERTKAATEFFSGLYKDCDQGFVELRYLPSRERIFVPLSEIKNWSSFPSNQNIYFGVSTRDGKGGTKENIVQTPALWIDVDFKEISRVSKIVTPEGNEISEWQMKLIPL